MLRALTSSSSDGGQVRWYFSQEPLGPGGAHTASPDLTRAASLPCHVPGIEVDQAGMLLRGRPALRVAPLAPLACLPVDDPPAPALVAWPASLLLSSRGLLRLCSSQRSCSHFPGCCRRGSHEARTGCARCGRVPALQRPGLGCSRAPLPRGLCQGSLPRTTLQRLPHACPGQEHPRPLFVSGFYGGNGGQR